MIRRYNYEILFEDNDVLVVNKPPYLPVIPLREPNQLPSLKEQLDKVYDNIMIVHRLDKNTSGALVFAKNAESHRTLSMDFENRNVHKRYHAVVYGRPQSNEGEIHAPISKTMNYSGKYTVQAGGRDSLTEYKIIEELIYPYFLVEFNLITGRTHQIRVHAEYAGFPLAVDPLYGHASEFYLSSVKKRFNIKKHEEERPLLFRNSLHARYIDFKHPTSGKLVSIKAPHFKDFRAFLNQLNPHL